MTNQTEKALPEWPNKRMPLTAGDLRAIRERDALYPYVLDGRPEHDVFHFIAGVHESETERGAGWSGIANPLRDRRRLIEHTNALTAALQKLIQHNECAECAHEVSALLATIGELPPEGRE